MARKTVGLLASAVLLVPLCLGLVGCGPKPPCEGATVTQVQSVQDECEAAKAGLEDAREERASLEADVTAAKTELSQLEGKPDELSGYLDELRKGSGR